MENITKITGTLHIGSENEHGEHLRDADAGWPYRIYALDTMWGGCDRVICHGIQSLADAEHILQLLTATQDKLTASYHIHYYLTAA